MSDRFVHQDGANHPHVIIQTLDGNVHIIPVTVITRIIYGDMKLENIDDWRLISSSILSEWLDNVRGTNATQA